MQQEEAAEQAADDAGRDQVPEALLLAFEVVELCESAADIAGAEGDGVGDVGGNGGQADEGQHGEGDEGAAAGEGVDGSGGNGSQADEEELKSG